MWELVPWDWWGRKWLFGENLVCWNNYWLNTYQCEVYQNLVVRYGKAITVVLSKGDYTEGQQASKRKIASGKCPAKLSVVPSQLKGPCNNAHDLKTCTGKSDNFVRLGVFPSEYWFELTSVGFDGEKFAVTWRELLWPTFCISWSWSWCKVRYPMMLFVIFSRSSQWIRIWLSNLTLVANKFKIFINTKKCARKVCKVSK